MEDHPCKHEAEIAVLVSEIPGIKEDIKTILGILQDNGKQGLCSRVTVIESKLKTVAWIVGIVFSGGGLTILGYVIRGMAQ